MTGRHSRNKGAAGERELFGILSERLGIPIKRGLSASREGGADSLDIPGLAVEVKRCEKENLPAWWRQAVDQAGDRLPVLFYRASRKPWACVVPVVFLMVGLDLPAGIARLSPVIVDLQTFCEVVTFFYLPRGEPEAVPLPEYVRKLDAVGIK